MGHKYSLKKILTEIKEDELVIKDKKNRWASQSDIREMVAAMKSKPKEERQG